MTTTVKRRLKALETQSHAGNRQVELARIPESATLEEAMKIYSDNLKLLKPVKTSTQPMTLEEATKIYTQCIESFPNRFHGEK